MSDDAKRIVLVAALGVGVVIATAMWAIGCGPSKPHDTRPVPGAFVVRTVPLALPTKVLLFRDVRPHLLACTSCHISGGQASGRLVYTSPSLRTTPADEAYDYATTLAFVDLGFPSNSPLLVKASAPHGGGLPGTGVAYWPPGSLAYTTVLDWIASGASFR